MANSKSNYPSEQVNDLDPDFVAETVKSLRELNDLGKPETDEEVRTRIDQYFEFCQDTGNRPGIESLCLAAQRYLIGLLVLDAVQKGKKLLKKLRAL